MPFNGTYEALIPSLRDDPDGTIDQLVVFAWEWLETNCATLRWTPAQRMTLAEIFGVEDDSPAADIQAARAHFDANPHDIKVAEMEDQGTHGRIDYTIVRTPQSVTAFDTAIAPQMAPTFWDWFGRYAVRLLADAIDRRVLKILDSMPGRILMYDLSQVQTITPKMLSALAAQKLSNPGMWLIHQTAARRISADTLSSGNMGAPVVTVGFEGSNIFPPTTCVVRDDQAGVHVLVADSLLVRATVLSDSRVDFELDIWGGMGVDISTGKVKAVNFDLGIKQGI